MKTTRTGRTSQAASTARIFKVPIMVLKARQQTIVTAELAMESTVRALN